MDHGCLVLALSHLQGEDPFGAVAKQVELKTSWRYFTNTNEIVLTLIRYI